MKPYSEETLKQLRAELVAFVQSLPRRERTVGHANMATTNQLRRLNQILDDFEEVQHAKN